MNLFGKLCYSCLVNKKLTLLLFIGIFLWGAISYVIMPKRYNPDITAPAFQVAIDFPGATLEEVYELATKPLENIVQEIPGVENVYSQSFHGGKSIITINFFVGEDMDSSKIRLQQQINSNLDLKPIGINNIFISTLDPDDVAIMTVLLDSEKLSPIQIRKKALEIRDQLKLIDGTAKIDIVGGQLSELQIIIDPNKLKQTNTSIQNIYAALNETSLLRSLGSIKGHDNYYTVETSGLIQDVKELENLVVTSNIDRSLKIKDFAKVIRGPQEIDQIIHYKSKSRDVDHAVFLTLSKKKSANITTLSKKIKNRLAELKKNASSFQNLSYTVLRDEGRVANEEINGLVINLVQAISIVLIILFLILNLRAAIVVSITIPLTILTVISLGNLFGFTINRITLFALILSLGLLVDSATVVVENIVRNRQMHPNKPMVLLISEAVSEVGMGLFLSTVTTVLAFIPMRFITGMMGPYMGALPFFIVTAILSALIFSYTLTPWLAYNIFSKNPLPEKNKVTSKNKLSRKFIHFYSSKLNAILISKRKRLTILTFCAGLILIVLTFPVLELIKFRMLPKADREQVYTYINMPDGISLEKTTSVTKEIAQKITENPQVKSVQSFIGTSPILDFNGLFKGASGRISTNLSTLRINLTHPNDRDQKSEDLTLQFRHEIALILKNSPNATFQMVEDPPGPPVQSTFLVKVKSLNQDLNKKIASHLTPSIKKIPELKDIDTTLIETHSKYFLKVDLHKAAIAQMNTGMIAETLRTLFSGYEIGVYHDNKNREQELITIKFNRDLRDEIKDLDKIYLTNKLGIPIQASRFLSIQKKPSQDRIMNDNRLPSVYISGEMGERSVTYAAIDFLKTLYKYKLHDGKGELVSFTPFGAKFLTTDKQEVFIEMGGEFEMTLEVFRDLGMAMLVAVLFIYIVLVAQFKSYLVPLLILGTIPLALVGVFPGFALLYQTHGVYFSATSMIGVIALAGIVVNNAIILLEYIIQSLEKNQSFLDAIVSSCVIRMRPIFLTSLTTILGSLAIAGDPVWSGLAWSIVFGLSLSAVLTLVIFPILLYQFVKPEIFTANAACEI